MKRTRKAAHGNSSQWTLRDLMTFAYDVCPDRATASKLIGSLLASRNVDLRHLRRGGR